MLMGLHLSTLQQEDALTPRNPYNDEHWAFPPAIILRTMSDEPDVIVRVNSTAAALRAQVGCSHVTCNTPFSTTPVASLHLDSGKLKGGSAAMRAWHSLSGKHSMCRE